MSDINQQQAFQNIFPKVKKAEVVEFSKALSAAQARFDALGIMNTTTDPVKRVEAAAQFRMANDAKEYAREQYDRAFDAWARGGYQE